MGALRFHICFDVIWIVYDVVFCRAAYFQGQVEQPVRGLTSLITHEDIAVLVAINAVGIYVIDECECVSIIVYRFLI